MTTPHHRHAELVSASIFDLDAERKTATWILKQVQDDVLEGSRCVGEKGCQR